MTTEITNTSGVSADVIPTLNKLGTFRNNWRLRMVTLYAHPTNPAEVISVGEGFGAVTGHTVICHEPRSSYRRQLDQNDWSPYN